MTEMNKSVPIAFVFLATLSPTAMAQDARQILEVGGVQGGLVVVIGCDRPALLAELRAGSSYLVHGLDRDPEKVAAARTDLQGKGLYGPVTVAQWDGSKLPFVDRLVNLVVATGEFRVASDEIARVLAPNGVAVRLDPEGRHLQTDRGSSQRRASRL